MTNDKKYTNVCGQCPNCNSMNLNYEPIELADDYCYFPYVCNNCKQRGEEWYSMQFVGHNVITSNGEIIEL